MLASRPTMNSLQKAKCGLFGLSDFLFSSAAVCVCVQLQFVSYAVLNVGFKNELLRAHSCNVEEPFEQYCSHLSTIKNLVAFIQSLQIKPSVKPCDCYYLYACAFFLPASSQL